MPRKKKTIIKKSSFQAEVETSDDQEEKPIRSLRPRCRMEAKDVVNKLATKYLGPSPKHKKKNDGKNKQSENAYDADSESDENPDLDSKADSEFNADEKSMNIDTCNISDSDAVMENTNIRNTTKLNNHNPFIIIDKENITPPGSHSTPAAAQRVVRNLDESLFGFNNLDSPLTLSPLRRTLDDPVSPAVSSRSSTVSVSPSKRKRVQNGISDIPIENPKKRTKKKPKKEVPIDDPLEEIRKQFREVEMHELVVEIE